MRRRVILGTWLALGVSGLAVYLVDGDRWRIQASIARTVTLAERASDPASAERIYAAALAALPKSATAFDRFELRRRAVLTAVDQGQIAAALAEFRSLCHEADSNRWPAEIVNELRQAEGRSAYYAAWQLRRAEAPPALWLPLAESARQQFAVLATDAQPAAQRNLERAVRLIRSSDRDLSSLPFPDDAPPVPLLDMSQPTDSSSAGRPGRPSDDRSQDSGGGDRKPGNGAGNNQTQRRGS